MRIDPRRAFGGLLIAGVAAGLLFMPALVFVGTLLAPSQPTPSEAHVPPLLGDAIWARGLGGRATELQAMNPFTFGRMMSCHLLAEINDDGSGSDKQHDECMKLMPGLQAVGYLSGVHLRSEGVWQDPRVPFVQFATMSKVSDTWTRAQLLDTLAARGEFGFGFVGADQAARGYFGKPAEELTVPQAALLASVLGDRRVGPGEFDPWCDPASAANRRRRILERMLDNGAIDQRAFDLAEKSDLGLGDPPPNHTACPK